MTTSSCTSSPSGALLRAFGEFNRGEWYDCHETLEELWVGSEHEIRWFYQGLLQIAVAFHHWRNGNYGGAVSLLTSGTNYLRRVSPVCQRIEVAAFTAEADSCKEELISLGPERMAELPATLIPRLRLSSTEGAEECTTEMLAGNAGPKNGPGQE